MIKFTNEKKKKIITLIKTEQKSDGFYFNSELQNYRTSNQIKPIKYARRENNKL